MLLGDFPIVLVFTEGTLTDKARTTLFQGSRSQACTPGPMSLAPYLVRSQRFVWLGAEFCYTFYFFEAVNLALLTDISSCFQGSRSGANEKHRRSLPPPLRGGRRLCTCVHPTGRGGGIIKPSERFSPRAHCARYHLSLSEKSPTSWAL